jgi:hypothetical protein
MEINMKLKWGFNTATRLGQITEEETRDYVIVTGEAGKKLDEAVKQAAVGDVQALLMEAWSRGRPQPHVSR